LTPSNDCLKNHSKGLRKNTKMANYSNGKAIYTDKKKIKIGNDDYIVYSTRFHGKLPHSYMLKRNGVWFSYSSKTKKAFLNRFPKLRGKF